MSNLTTPGRRVRVCELAIALLALCVMCSCGAVTVVECQDSDGSVSYRDVCPPETTRVGERRITGSRQVEQITLEEVAKRNPVTLYVVPDCDTCDLVRLQLQKRGVPFTERNVQDDAALQQELEKISGATKVPTVVIGTTSLPGFDRILLHQRLTEAGYPENAADTSAAPPTP